MIQSTFDSIDNFIFLKNYFKKNIGLSIKIKTTILDFIFFYIFLLYCCKI